MTIYTARAQSLHNFYTLAERLIKLPPSPSYSILLGTDGKTLILVTPHGAQLSFMETLDYTDFKITVSLVGVDTPFHQAQVSLLSLATPPDGNRVSGAMAVIKGLFVTRPDKLHNKLIWVSITAMLDEIEKDLKVRKGASPRQKARRL